jgi:hypothetical protein
MNQSNAICLVSRKIHATTTEVNYRKEQELKPIMKSIAC